MGQSVDELLKELTLEEKCSLLSGETFNDSQSVPRLGIEKMLMTDGPHGLRKQSDKPDHLGMNVSVPATCFPPACALGSSWNREIVYKMGEALASECRAENVQRTPIWPPTWQHSISKACRVRAWEHP